MLGEKHLRLLAESKSVWSIYRTRMREFVLSVLCDAGRPVRGADISHLSFKAHDVVLKLPARQLALNQLLCSPKVSENVNLNHLQPQEFPEGRMSTWLGICGAQI